MSKFIIKKIPKEDQYRPVMLNESTYNMLVQLKEITGMTIGSIAQSAIKYAIDNLEIQED